MSLEPLTIFGLPNGLGRVVLSVLSTTCTQNVRIRFVCMVFSARSGTLLLHKEGVWLVKPHESLRGWPWDRFCEISTVQETLYMCPKSCLLLKSLHSISLTAVVLILSSFFDAG